MATIDKLIQLMMGVTDMEKSKQFYADAMGFAVTTDFGQGDRRWVNLSFPEGGVTLTLTTFLAEHLKPGTMSLYVAAPNIQQAYDDLTAKGVQPTDPISDDLYGPGSGVKWFRFADPDGNVLTIVQSKQ
jgi:catechol 2,3-dioxygenase-like lactoylglutathione lyase family enzyme